MRKGLLATTAVVLVLAAALAASGEARTPRRGPSRSGLERVPARLVPAARALLQAGGTDRVPHSTKAPRKQRGSSHRRVLPRIVGGTGAVQGQFGFMAFLVYYDSNNNPLFLCTGTLVSPNVILTAGHCATDESTGAVLAAGGYRAVTGAVNWTNARHRTVSHVSRVVVNPGFTHSGGVPIHDAALLVLSSPVGHPTIPLWSAGQVPAGQRAVIAGWGETFQGQTTPQSLLQWAPTVVQSPSYCGRFDPAFQPSTQLCAVNAPADDTATCNGDSGGPLLATDANHHPFEIGVISVGPADCDSTTADYFTAVRPIEPWVSSVVKAVESSPKIPRLTLAAARLHTRQTLRGVLGSVFRQKRHYRVGCSRDSEAKVGCGVSFLSGPNYYRGTATIRYVLHSGQVRWTDRYVISSVNSRCFHSKHSSSCQVQRRSGSF